MEPSPVYEFGPFRLDAANAQLLRDGRPVALPPKTFDVLRLLVGRAGQLVEKDALLREVWPDAFVEEANLSRHVWTLRKVLGDNGADEAYIETVPKRGYRFATAVTTVEPARRVAVASPPQQEPIERVREQLERIVRSPSFARTGRLRDFLRFVVEAVVAGRQGGIKESTIALEVCGRDATFDPKADPIVRVDATRLRARLEAYYQTEGQLDPIRIDLPKGSYVPVIRPAADPGARSTPGRTMSTVAVLPFVNLGPSEADTSVGDGLAGELIHQLSRLGGLRVMARTSTFHFRGVAADLRRLATELAVNYVVEGSVRIAYDQIRVTAQLTDVTDLTVRWSAKYERRLENVLAVEDDICRNLARALEVHLTGAPVVSDRSRSQAHIEYLKGRYYWNRRTADALQQSLEQYRKGTEIDPTYAPSYCGIADTLLVQALNEQVPSTDAMPRARTHADRALELQPDLAEALVSSAAIASVYDWHWERGEALFREAIGVNPNFPLAHYLFAVVNLAPRASWDAAYVEMDRALELDPVSPVLYRDLGIIQYLHGQYREAEESLCHARRLDPGFQAALFWTARALAEQRRFEEALAMLEARLTMPAANTRVSAVLIHTLARMGRQVEARERLAELQRTRSEGLPPLNMAIAMLGLGEPEQALGHLERAVVERAVPLYQLAVDPIYAPLHGAARFQAILGKMQLDRVATRRA